MTQLAQERERNRMWQNRSVIILAAIILAIIIVRWVVQLAGGLQRPVSQSGSITEMFEMGACFAPRAPWLEAGEALAVDIDSQTP